MEDKLQQAFELCQQGVIEAAEHKLGRELTDNERAGLRRIRSLMMLESCEQMFNAPATPIAEVLMDLEYFANQSVQE